jgi:hypothetical protein
VGHAYILLLAAHQDEFGSSFEASCLRDLAENSRNAYLQAFRRFVVFVGEDERAAAGTLLRSYLLTFAVRGLSSSSGKHILSSIRLAEDFGWLTPIVSKASWRLVRALDAVRLPRHLRPGIVWADADIFFVLASRCLSLGSSVAEPHWEWMARAILSVTALLRVSEACSAARAQNHRVRFCGAKSRTGWHLLMCGPLATLWLDVLQATRTARGDPSHVSSPVHMEKWLESSLAGTSHASARWHSFRRFAAATLQSLGVPFHIVKLLGGWAATSTASLYTAAPADWTPKRRALLPFPQVRKGVVEIVHRECSLLAFWPAWVRAETSTPAGISTREPGRPPKRRRGTSVPRDATADPDDDVSE